VIAGLAFTTTKDTTLTAVGDTIKLRATGLAKTATGTVARALTGLAWSIKTLGATAFTAVGDSARLIAQANGADTVIVRHLYCLAGARCADTAIVRVAQVLTVAVATPSLAAWSLGDTVSSSVTLRDRRGFGQPGAFLTFVPKTAADSAVVKVTSLIGTSEATTGAMAVSRFVAAANGTAAIAVKAFTSGGVLLDTASLSVMVRQVAIRTAVLPLVASISDGDSIPLKAVAYDARSNAIGDATLAYNSIGTVMSGIWAIGSAPTTSTTTGVWVGVSGPALAASNVGAPAVPLAVDTAQIQSVPPYAAVAGSDSIARTVAASAKRAGGVPVSGAWVRFSATRGTTVPDSAQTSALGAVQTVWTPANRSGKAILTVIQRSGTTAPASVADSAGLILARRSVTVVAAPPSGAASSIRAADTVMTVGTTTTLTITALDRYGNAVNTVQPTDFNSIATTGSIGIWTCIANVCTATYTAAGVVGTATLSADFAGDVIGSAFDIRTVAGAPSAVLSTASIAAGPYIRNTGYTVTVSVKDTFGNAVTGALATDFTVTPTVGTFGAWVCIGGTCTATYTTPNAAAPAATITIQIGAVNVIGSPIVIAVP
jgi:adhesin/invasin